MNSKADACEICGRKDGKLAVIWYGQLDEYVKGERGEREARNDGERGTSSLVTGWPTAGGRGVP